MTRKPTSCCQRLASSSQRIQQRLGLPEIGGVDTRGTQSVDGAGMIEAASDSGAAQVAEPDDGSVIDALRRGDHIERDESSVTRCASC
jgi:hypothetical protein